MSESARNYQAQVQGHPRALPTASRGTGRRWTLTASKMGPCWRQRGRNYAKFYDDELNFLGIFKGDRKMLKAAQRHARVANGTPIRWIVAEEKFAGALRMLFEENGIGIEVVHVLPE